MLYNSDFVLIRTFSGNRVIPAMMLSHVKLSKCTRVEANQYWQRPTARLSTEKKNSAARRKVTSHFGFVLL